MKAAFIQETGEPDIIQYGDLPDPCPSKGQLLIEVEAVSVNPIDTYIRSGKIPMETPKPFIVGSDFAGKVIQCGEGATRFKVGERVWGSNQGLLGRQGTFAEQIVVDEQWTYPTPDAVSSEDVAAASLVGITAHLGLFAEAQLQSDKRCSSLEGVAEWDQWSFKWQKSQAPESSPQRDLAKKQTYAVHSARMK